jgi:hypothetical protein
VKAAYDMKTDTLSIVFRSGVKIAERDEEKPGVILDYDEDGNLSSRWKSWMPHAASQTRGELSSRQQADGALLPLQPTLEFREFRPAFSFGFSKLRHGWFNRNRATPCGFADLFATRNRNRNRNRNQRL